MILSLVGRHWFPLADAILVLLCGLAWYRWPQAGGWLLPVALTPWLLRTIAGRETVRRTLLDVPIGLFVLTALLGVWASYDRLSAWAKFWQISSAVLLYYALSRQPRLNFWKIAYLFSSIAAVIGLYFMLTHDWFLQPADLALLNRLGTRWMTIRPDFQSPSLHPNIAGGLIAAFFPFLVALGLRAWQRREVRTGVITAVLSLLAFIGLVFTSSRAAWLALLVGLGAWFLWGLSALIAQRLSQTKLVVFLAIFLPISVAIMLLVLVRPVVIIDLLGNLPGLNSSVSRLELYANSLKMLVDFPFTGGGLAAFPGLYSQYVMVVPVFLFGYSHNLYIDLALEQSLLGLIAFLAIMGASLWISITTRRSPQLRWACIAGLLVMLTHGLADDALYGVQGTPLLFALPGLAVAIYRYQGNTNQPVSQAKSDWRTGLSMLAILSLVALSLVMFVSRGALRSSWFANLGAVRMAQYELLGFPSAVWQESLDLEGIYPAIASLRRSLQADPENVTANYRLGLLAMLGRDFRTAQTFLEQAYHRDPNHRGVKKVLGYCYAWLGRPEQAASLLVTIPEARTELEVYMWWWSERGRDDLSGFAAETINRLDVSALAPP